MQGFSTILDFFRELDPDGLPLDVDSSSQYAEKYESLQREYTYGFA